MFTGVALSVMYYYPTLEIQRPGETHWTKYFLLLGQRRSVIFHLHIVCPTVEDCSRDFSRNFVTISIYIVILAITPDIYSKSDGLILELYTF